MEDEEGDCAVLAGDRDDRERAEELVVAEDAGQRVGAPADVDDRAGAVDEAACDQQRAAGGAEPGDDLR